MLGQDTRKGRKNETCMARRVALALSEWNWEGWEVACMHLELELGRNVR